jgi:hypothetical protein
MLLLLRKNVLIALETFNFTLKSVDYFDCRLCTCVNNSLPINWSSQASFILRTRKEVWLPVNLTREWQHSPLEGLMTKVVSKLLTRSKRFIKWVILAIVGLYNLLYKVLLYPTTIKILQTSEAMVMLGLLHLKNKKGGIVRASQGDLACVSWHLAL